MKAAVIGCGRMGAFTSESVRRFAPPCWFPLAHADAIAAHPKLELAALCDANPDSLARACAAYGDPPGFTDHRELAEVIRPELASIATRTIGRAEVIQTLSHNGTRAFHIEKPLCNSVAELAELDTLFARNDIFATYGAVRRHFAIYQAARALVDSGRFGRLVEVRANFGAGALYWTQPHAIDLLLFAAAGREVSGVQARLGPLEPGERPGEVVNDPLVQSATIWFEDGVAGQIGRAPGCDLVLSCERGEVTVTSDGGNLWIAEPHGDDPYLVRAPIAGTVATSAPQGTFAPISQLAACLSGDDQAEAANAVVKRDIVLGQRIAFALVQSHLEGSRMVQLVDIDPHLRVLARSGANFA